MENYPLQKPTPQKSLQFPSPHPKDQFLGKVLFQKYLLTKKLGEGSFGRIYKASTKTEVFAFKIEKKRIQHSLLENEAAIMSKLQDLGPGIPRIYSFIPGPEYNIMIMQLLGKSLEYLLHHLPSKTMTLQTVCNVAIQMLSILELVHNNHYIHRDIKPDNFVVGLGANANALYLIDFGLAKMYRDPHTLVQNEMIMRKKLTGTARYASIHALQGMEQSRRDDIESVAYVVVYLINGALPWQGFILKNKEDKYAKILKKKNGITDEELCKGLPKQFSCFVSYARNLAYEECPKYDYMRSLFEDCLNEKGLKYEKVYDWNRFTRANSVKVKDSQQNFDNCNHVEENNDLGIGGNEFKYNNVYGNQNHIFTKKTENYSTNAQIKKQNEHSFSFSNNNNVNSNINHNHNNNYLITQPHNAPKTIINNYFTNNTNTIILKHNNSNNTLKHKFNHSGEAEFNGEAGYYSSLFNSQRYPQCADNTYANINTATNNNKSFKSHLTSKKRTSAHTISTKPKKMSSGLLEHNNRYSNSNINNAINECATPPKMQRGESSNSNLKMKNTDKGKKGCISKCCVIL